jgi:hypothetical protein
MNEIWCTNPHRVHTQSTEEFLNYLNRGWVLGERLEVHQHREDWAPAVLGKPEK